MRETVRSLRAYFLLSGLAGLLIQAVTLLSPLRSTNLPGYDLTDIVAIVGIGLSIAFLYVGAVLPALLRNAVSQIVTLLYVSAGWLVVSSVAGFFVGGRLWVAVGLAIGLLIVWYLLRNVRRLAEEAQNAMPAA
jgi:hypothetical protein